MQNVNEDSRLNPNTEVLLPQVMQEHTLNVHLR